MPVDIHGMVPLLQVFDMPTSIHFYRDLLGFEIVNRNAETDDCDWIWLRRSDVEVMLNTAFEKEHRPERPDPTRTANHGDTCLYIGCPDVDKAYEYLKERGISAKAPKVAPYGMKQLYFSDPDGYKLCFQWQV